MNLFQEISLTRSIQYYRFLRYFFLFLTAIALTRIGVGQSVIGAYEIYLHIIYSLSFFWANGLFQAVLIKKGTTAPSERSHLLSSIWGLLLSIIGTVSLIILIVGPQLLELLAGVPEVPNIHLMGWVATSSLAPLVFEYFIIAKEEGKKLLFWGCFSFLGHFLATILPFIGGQDFTVVLYAHLGLNILRFLYMITQLPSPDFKWKSIPLGREAFWLSLYTIIGGIPIAFDTWLIGFFTSSVEEVAVFRFGARELPLIIILLGGLHIGMLSDLSAHETAVEKLKQQVLKTMHILGPLAVLLIFISPFLFEFIFTSAFRQSSIYFNIYLFLLMSRWIMSQTLVMAKGGFSYLLKIGVLELTLNIGLSFLFIYQFGPSGVVWATVIAFLFEKLALSIWLFMRFGISIQTYLPIRWYLLYTSLMVLSFLIPSQWS